MITVVFDDENETREMPQANTVLQLLNRLGKRHTEVLVIRDKELLTPDVALKHGDVITLRSVGSRG